MSIINTSSASIQDIETNIIEYLHGLSNWDEIKDLMPASNMKLIVDLMSGWGSYVIYKQMMARGETHPESSRLESTVYRVANTFGYSIHRYTAPTIEVKYMSNKSLTLTRGLKLGTYGKYDLVYFGENRILEKLDEFIVQVGTYKEIDTTVKYIGDLQRLTLQPQTLKSVDDTNIALFIRGDERALSKAIEDYVVTNKAMDFSTSNVATKLFISDSKNRYGLTLKDGQPLKVSYLETDGRLETPFKLKDVKLETKFVPLKLTHEGANGDSLEKIRRLAPLFYSTLRRMVTTKDHKYVLEAHPYIKSASAKRDLGTPQKDKVSFNEPIADKNFSFKAAGVVYSNSATTSDTKEDLAKRFEKLLERNSALSCEVTPEFDLILSSTDSRNSDYAVDNPINVTIENLESNMSPPCCTVNLFYVLESVIEDPKVLTTFEENEVIKYLRAYKMVGLRLLLKPAKVQKYAFKIKIKLTDNKYYNQVSEKIHEILNAYEFKVEQGFKYGTALADIVNIEIRDDGKTLEPITSIVPNQDIFNVPASFDTYIKFNEVEILLA